MQSYTAVDVSWRNMKILEAAIFHDLRRGNAKHFDKFGSPMFGALPGQISAVFVVPCLSLKRLIIAKKLRKSSTF